VACDLAARGWRLQAVATNNGSEFRSAEFQSTVARLDAEHRFIHAGRPQTNGCVERVQRTILDECWKPVFARYLVPEQTGVSRELERFLHDYNTDRAHNGRYTNSRTPDAVLGQAKVFTT
jgi:transposase InsO family protein